MRRYAVQDERMLDKTLEHLRIEKIASEVAVEEATRDAARCFRGLYACPGFPAFEKEAMALFGVEADPMLDGMRRELRLPEVNRNHAKVASLLVMDDKTAAHRAFARGMAAQKRLADIQTTLARHGRA
jgi:hypothetical protein